MPLRVIFMGTPQFSVPTLQALHQKGHDILCVYTQPPRPSGSRGLKKIPSPIQLEAEKLGIITRIPISLRSELEQEQFHQLKADIAVVVAYGLLLPPKILSGTRFGCYNTHTSILPRWRGAAPIQRAIMEGDTETGITIIKMDENLDTGPIAMSTHFSIPNDINAGKLSENMMTLAAELMVETLHQIETHNLTLQPQIEKGTLYAEKITSEETKINWNKPAKEVHNHIRGLSPFPGSWCYMGKNQERVKILASFLCESQSGEAGTVLDEQLTIACKIGSVRILTLQKQGKKILSAEEFLRGTRIEKGTKIF